MKRNITSIAFAILLGMQTVACAANNRNIQTYVGSTPAHFSIRQFLRISLTDSIDFIRWHLELGDKDFTLICKYGLSKPNTPGFIDEKQVSFSGPRTLSDHYNCLSYKDESLCLLEVNDNILHFLDAKENLLSGNGGYSYALNNISPVSTNAFNAVLATKSTENPVVFEGRTPCQELSTLLNLQRSQDCFKLKWYLVFYTDENGRPSYYQKKGVVNGKTDQERGSWKISNTAGHIVYQLQPDDKAYTLFLLRADGNVLFFANANGQPLVGNEDFSYTLNRRIPGYDPTR